MLPFFCLFIIANNFTGVIIEKTTENRLSVFKHIKSTIKPDMTEKQVAWMMEKEMHEACAKMAGFVKVVKTISEYA